MPRNLKKVARVKLLRDKGKSFREIARLLRADVRSVYRWHTYSGGTHLIKTKRRRKSIKQLKLHLSARGKVRWALKTGKLVSLSCKECGDLKTEAHHPNYSKALNVEWLCNKHHNLRHNSVDSD